MRDPAELDIVEIPRALEVRPRAFADSDPASTSYKRAAAGKGSSRSEENTRSSRSRSRTSTQPRRVPVVIIDESTLFRAGLASILAGSRFQVTASGSSLGGLSESGFSDKRCLALISLDEEADTMLPRATALAERGVRVIILGKQLRPDEVFAALEAGAGGYLLKNEISPDALVKSLELVWLGGVVIPQGFAKLLQDRAQLDPLPVPENPTAISEDGQTQFASDTAQTGDVVGQTGDVGRLSNRERTILKQLTQGAANKHIARELSIAEATVKINIKSLFRKIHVNNRTQAAIWAMDNGDFVNGFSHWAGLRARK